MQHSGRGPKVSLRGASAKEVSRDALIEKAAQERASRLLARKASASAVHIQRVWRGRRVARQLAEREGASWDEEIASSQRRHTADSISKQVLRPLLFLVSHDSRISFHDQKGAKNASRLVTCFKLLRESISSCDPQRNFCSLAIGSQEEQARWVYQAHRVLELCSAVLANTGCGWQTTDRGVAVLPDLAVRVMVALTDASMWNSMLQKENRDKANLDVLNLLEWLSKGNSGLFPAVRSYVMTNCPVPRTGTQHDHPPERDKFLVTVSAITMALRPLIVLSAAIQSQKVTKEVDRFRASSAQAAEMVAVHILTVPFLVRRLPASLVPALQHPFALAPCLRSLGVPLNGLSKVAASCSKQMSKVGHEFEHIPPSLWALANLVSLASGSTSANSKSKEGGAHFVEGLICEDYVQALCCLLEDLSPWIESKNRQHQQIKSRHSFDNDNDCEVPQFGMLAENALCACEDSQSVGIGSVLQQLLENLKPAHQAWHLQQLLDACKSSPRPTNESYGVIEAAQGRMVLPRKSLGLPDVAKLYSNLVAVFSVFILKDRSNPILGVLAVSQSLFPRLWEWLQNCLKLPSPNHHQSKLASQLTRSSSLFREGNQTKNAGGKWAAALVLRMRTRSSGAEGSSSMEKVEAAREPEADKSATQIWNFEPMKKGSVGVPADAVPVLSLFCASYAHLLVVMDDEQFYERQFPFTLEQQRVIAAMLNTMVFNGLMAPSKTQNAHLMAAAVGCLRLLYERDCRRSYCEAALWLAPALSLDLPTAAAARAHREVSTASARRGDSFQAPGLGAALTTIPHVFPFEKRVHIFREFVRADKLLKRMGGEAVGPGPGTIEIAVRRDHIVEDGFAQLSGLGSKLKSCINVSFVNELGLSEAGLDYGGLFKEFLTNLAKSAFDPGYGLFIQTATEEGLLFPHQAAESLLHGLQMIEFLGQIIGKALYEGILLEYSFSPLFVSNLLSRSSFLDDLASLDAELHRNLMYLKHYEDDARDLALDFTVTQELFGKHTVVELKSGGADIPVTNENKLNYVYEMADYKLNRQMRPIVLAFSKGLSDLIPLSWLGLFNAKEFNQLLSGGEHDFDVEDLRAHTRYTGGFTDTSRTVKLFWEVVAALEPHERCALLKFVTSCSRAPLLGFKHLQPAFTIHKVVCDAPVWAIIGGQDVERLPSASTCYNTLKLPTYKRMSTLREKLRYAICSNAGFELS